MNAHKRRRRRLLHVEQVETIRPFRPPIPSREARFAELRFFRDERRRAIVDPDAVGLIVLPGREGTGKERTCIDGVWSPWTHFTYGSSESPQGALP